VLETAGAGPDSVQQTLAASEIRRVDRHGELAYVVTGQWVTTRERITAPDEWNVAEEYVSRLFTCTEIDGAWFIESTARWQPDPQSSADPPTGAWIPDMLARAKGGRQRGALDADQLRQVVEVPIAGMQREIVLQDKRSKPHVVRGNRRALLA